jgi:hypothetical protein
VWTLDFSLKPSFVDHYLYPNFRSILAFSTGSNIQGQNVYGRIIPPGDHLCGLAVSLAELFGEVQESILGGEDSGHESRGNK